MVDELNTASQVATEEPPAQAGPPMADHPAEGTVSAAQPGTEKQEATLKPAVPPEQKPRVYTNEEVTQIRADYDRQSAQLRDRIAQTELRDMQQRAEAEERAAEDRLKQAVEQGLLTSEEASTGKTLRQELRQMGQVYQHYAPRMDVGLRIVKALDLAEQTAAKEGLNEFESAKLFKSILMEKDVKDPNEYESRLNRKLADKYKEQARLARLDKEKHDRGPGTGTVTGPESEEAKIARRFPNSPDLK